MVRLGTIKRDWTLSYQSGDHLSGDQKSTGESSISEDFSKGSFPYDYSIARSQRRGVKSVSSKKKGKENP